MVTETNAPSYKYIPAIVLQSGDLSACQKLEELFVRQETKYTTSDKQHKIHKKLELIHSMGINLNNDTFLVYQEAVSDCILAEDLDKVILEIPTLYIPFSQEMNDLYVNIVKYSPYSERYEKVFNLLNGLQFEFSKATASLYAKVFVNISDLGPLDEAFGFLNDAGAKGQEGAINLYNSVCTGRKSLVIKSLKILNQLGIKYTSDTHLIFELAFDKWQSFQNVVNKLLNVNIKVCEENFHYYTLALTDNKLLNDITPVLDTLSSAKCFYDKYPKLFETLFDPNVEFNIKASQVDAVIDQTITYGPLNKSISTKKIESLLEDLSRTKLDDIYMWFDESEGYLISSKDIPEKNITLLLQCANLGHIHLSNNTISGLRRLMVEPWDGFRAV